MLYDVIKKDLTKYRLARESEYVKYLSTLLGEIEAKPSFIDTNGKKTFSDADVINKIKKTEKNILEYVALPNVGDDKKEELTKELRVISMYLPIQLNEDGIKKAFADSGASTMPELMKYMKTNFEGLYDGKVVSQLAKVYVQG
jgi:uncharacterized protein YqeY